MFIVGNKALSLYDLDNNRQVGHVPYLEEGAELVVRKTFTYSYSVNPGSIISITGNNFNVSTPTGYSFFALRGFDTGTTSGGLVLVSIMFGTGSSPVMKIRNINTSGGASSATASVIFEFIKTQFDGGTV